jgi:hypothetical protein
VHEQAAGVVISDPSVNGSTLAFIVFGSICATYGVTCLEATSVRAVNSGMRSVEAPSMSSVNMLSRYGDPPMT